MKRDEDVMVEKLRSLAETYPVPARTANEIESIAKNRRRIFAGTIGVVGAAAITLGVGVAITSQHVADEPPSAGRDAVAEAEAEAEAKPSPPMLTDADLLADVEACQADFRSAGSPTYIESAIGGPDPVTAAQDLVDGSLTSSGSTGAIPGLSAEDRAVLVDEAAENATVAVVRRDRQVMAVITLWQRPGGKPSGWLVDKIHVCRR